MKPKGLIKRVFEFAVAELERRSRPPPPGDEPEAVDARRELATAHAATERIEPHGEEREPKSVRPVLGGLHLTRTERGALKVRWAVAPDEIDRSATLLDEGAVLCLRLVSFAAGRDHVLREVQDRPSISNQGECEMARPEGRAVVSLGLRAGGRFVSIAHHVV